MTINSFVRYVIHNRPVGENFINHEVTVYKHLNKYVFDTVSEICEGKKLPYTIDELKITVLEIMNGE